MALCKLMPGICWDLENQAMTLLMRDRRTRGLTTPAALLSEEYGWLSEGQLKFRQDREVYNSFGYPDPEIVSGILWRAYNPLFGKRPQRQLSEV